MTFELVEQAVKRCSFPEYVFHVKEDGRGAWYLQGAYLEACIETGVEEWQQTRRWLLSPLMSESEVVQTVFKCALTSMEHRTREHFLYRERPVFGPHMNVEALWLLAVPEEKARREG